MLTRPFAFKGPADHLEQFFELSELYQGMQILLQDSLMDWQYSVDNEQVSGVFIEQGRLLKCRLAWPLSRHNLSYCDCTSNTRLVSANNWENATAEIATEFFCHHQAALAIESKVRMERLPQALKPASQFPNELAYLSDWLSRQRFDPFPNMARHRVLYILEGDLIEGDLIERKSATLRLSVHKGYLTQQNEYQRKDDLPLAIGERDKLPKFISLTDQQIIQTINELCKELPALRLSDNSVNLEFPRCATLLQMLVNSGRCFWRSCHRPPMGWQVAPQPLQGSWMLSESLWFDKTNNRFAEQASPLDWRAETLAEALTKNENLEVTPILTVTSDNLEFVNQMQFSQTPLLEVDLAIIEFESAGVTFKLQEILSWWKQLSGLESSHFLEKIAGLIHQLDWLQSLAANFESPLIERFDIADRYLNGPIGHWFVLFRALQSAGWCVTFDAQFKFNQQLVDDWYSKVVPYPVNRAVNTEQSANWFELELGVMVDGRSVNVLPLIVDALKRGLWQESESSSYVTVTLDDGSRIRLARQRLQNIIDNLLELWDSKPLNRDKKLTLPASQFTRLLSLESSLNRNTEWQDLQWLHEKAMRISRLTDLKNHAQSNGDLVPDNVHATLRYYQREGVFWLQTLRQEGLAGVLADDMGLGKTLQALCHLQIEKNSGRLTAPCMVLVPTSLLGNWHAEARRFTPQLKVLRWSGSQRMQQEKQLTECDLIITSYGVLQRDADLLNALNLYCLILDEAQTIKNSRSRIARLCYAMHAKHRLCLTGTPLENHLGELWSLYHFLMPGFLGDEAQFKRLFQQPIEKENDFQRQKALSQRVAPFLLRRTKALVAADLPQKSIIDELIELTESQADFYEATRLSMLEEVQKALYGKTRNALLIGNALLRLRQICCHPALLKSSHEIRATTAEDSAKLQWLLTVLPEMLENQQKVLIFSSFTRMLDIIADELQKLEIPYLMLTGKTRRRSELVARFQAGEVPVFLISLKAGGAGLNLTHADTVIHYDPWWNPAAETQASDRAHRIGQDKPVFVYKLIGKGTVEERIQLMQEKKQQLADQLYQAQSTATLNESDWQALLAPLED